MKKTISLTVNGVERTAEVEPRLTLLDLVREHFGLTGAKLGCDVQVCGACTLLVNGKPISACSMLAVDADGCEVLTIEGVSEQNKLHPVQEAFVEFGALQCGYCTPGQIMSAVALLAEGHAGDDAEIAEWMSGNICRCAAYPNIRAAIRDVRDAAGGER